MLLRTITMTCLFVAAVLFSAPLAALAPTAPAGPSPTADAPLWTTWGARQYALAGDGESIWIAASGSVVRWDKATAAYRRYSAIDGLAHTKVLAVAVDSAGNRWFGGDAGVSMFDPAETWTHLRHADSGLHSNLVDGIAAVALPTGSGVPLQSAGFSQTAGTAAGPTLVGAQLSDALYFSHGLPDGPVTRLTPDGAWRWFPNRETAIQADYAAIVRAGGSNPLWTVAGTEVWAGWSVFDGAAWIERRPAGVTADPTALVVDHAHHVLALDPPRTIYEWDGTAWVSYMVSFMFTGRVTSLVVDAGNEVWVGMQERVGNPYTSETALLKHVPRKDPRIWDTQLFTYSGPVAALIATDAGLWGIGPAWLMSPDYVIHPLTDTPRFDGLLADAIVGPEGAVWLYTGIREPYSTGIVQSLDDRGTPALDDDVWTARSPEGYPNHSSCEVVTAFDRRGADLWYATYCDWRGPTGHMAIRYHNGERIQYWLPFSMEVTDVFAENAGITWFAAVSHGSYGVDAPRPGQISRLDDRGTPADTTDDTWQHYPLESVPGRLSVAVDAAGRVWRGDDLGLYRLGASEWQVVHDYYRLCDLTPARDGTLYAQVAGSYEQSTCAGHPDNVLIVGPDGSLVSEFWTSIGSEALQHLDTVRTATRHNSLWSVAADGSVWYINDYDKRLERRSSSGLLTYPLPVELKAVDRLEVDYRGEVWLVANGQLWRMTGMPIRQTLLPLVGGR